MKTQGESEAAVRQGMSHFEQHYMGPGPKSVHAHLIGELLVVRLQGELTVSNNNCRLGGGLASAPLTYRLNTAG